MIRGFSSLSNWRSPAHIHKEALFTCLDDFKKVCEEQQKHCLIPSSAKRRRAGELSMSEMLFIMVFFHLSGFRRFKLFCLYGVCRHCRSLFGELPSYGRFVMLQPRLFMPLYLLMHCLSSEKTGVRIADSSHIPVCHDRRISRNKAFAGLAARGRGRASTVWFHGFKPHVIINDKSEITALKITPGNVDDRAALDAVSRGLKGEIFADKGYIPKKPFMKPRQRGLRLITGIPKNMKNYLMPMIDKLLPRRRFVVETVFDALKGDVPLGVETRMSDAACRLPTRLP